eukprot:gene10164-12470_t
MASIEFESYRLQKLIDEISILRLDCDWIQDQTEQSFKSIIEKGYSDFLYQELVSSIGKELSGYYDLQWPNLNEKSEAERVVVLRESLLKLLKELEYPISSINLESESFEDRLALLETLFLQLQLIQLELYNNENEIELFSVQFNNLDNFTQALHAIHSKIQEVVALLPEGYMSEPFFKNTVFSDDEKKKIQDISTSLYQDYTMRSTVLQKRLDVTVESLLWSEKVADKVEDITKTVKYLKSKIPDITHYTYLDLINAHVDILRVVKTSLTGQSAKSTNVIIVGNVPDRGGRSGDRKLAMPSFHKRVEFGHGGKKQHWSKHKKQKKEPQIQID